MLFFISIPTVVYIICKLELELYFYLNTVNLSEKIIIKIITIYFNLYEHDLKM